MLDTNRLAPSLTSSQCEPDPELDEVVRGLSAAIPHVSPKWFYDDVGSALFEAITRLPEYYPTRCELEILDHHGAAIGRQITRQTTVVELGSGSAQKIGRLLPHLPQVRTFRPIDVSSAALDVTAADLAGRFPRLSVDPLQADFSDHEAMRPQLRKAAANGPVLLFFPGSTIGNFERQHATALLRSCAEALTVGTPFLLGVDLVKPRPILQAAYDDPVGATAAFNRNMLAHLNRRFDGDFDPAQWRHEARWVPDLHRIEMWLRCDTAQTVRLGHRVLHFPARSGIHTENSHKWDRPRLGELARATGWRVAGWWTDRRGWFAQALLIRSDNSTLKQPPRINR